MFHFLDGLKPTTQAWLRTQKPQDLRAAMQAAEELGSTLATIGQSQAQKRIKITTFNTSIVG